MRQTRARHNRIRDVIKVETRVFLLLCRTCNLPVFETPIRYTFMYSNNGYLIVILLTPLLSSRQSIVLLKYVFCFSDGSYIERCEQAMGPTLIKRSLEPTNPWQLRNYRTKIQLLHPGQVQGTFDYGASRTVQWLALSSLYCSVIVRFLSQNKMYEHAAPGTRHKRCNYSRYETEPISHTYIDQRTSRPINDNKCALG